MDGRIEWALVATTVATREQADALARHLVDLRLAACVQISSVDSVYRWNDTVESGQECLLTIKIRATRFAAVSAAIAASHPYDVPEIVMTPILEAAASYAAWLASTTD